MNGVTDRLEIEGSARFGPILDGLLEGAQVRREPVDEGLTLYPVEGHQKSFDDLVRRISDRSGIEYVAFSNRAGDRYESVLVVPFLS